MFEFGPVNFAIAVTLAFTGARTAPWSTDDRYVLMQHFIAANPLIPEYRVAFATVAIAAFDRDIAVVTNLLFPFQFFRFRVRPGSKAALEFRQPFLFLPVDRIGFIIA
ncbi:hypothetical protein SDC9_136181 [bioreactor metagenome]|uniref:Uncharacterized protein n=1 Tax=bioreactor metagenome TaxID=1076179 RepID=A0A645DJR6_9ZZZZ